jgi:hypothetical protein
MYYTSGLTSGRTYCFKLTRGKVMKFIVIILLFVCFLLSCGSGNDYYPGMMIGEMKWIV